jgi:hypothetical protein
MFPQNPQPEGLPTLMKTFKDGGEIHRFVRVQLVAGAKVALAWLLVHYPALDLDSISQSLPEPKGGGLINMDPFYADSRRPAIQIIRHMLDKDAEFFINFEV